MVVIIVVKIKTKDETKTVNKIFSTGSNPKLIESIEHFF